MSDTFAQCDIRRPPSWFKPPDERILECLASREHGNMTPMGVSRDGKVARVDISRGYASRRLSDLAEAGFAVELDSALYGISERGLRFLSGEVDASDVPDPDDADASDSG